MAEGVISDLAAKALATLGKGAFKEAVSWWGARDDLKKLENTMTFIHARVRDAERCQEGENSELIKLWLRKLKRVLYRADDLFDLVLTLDLENPRIEKSKLEKVGILFSKPVTSLKSNRKLAHEIRSIRKELDDIKSNMDGLNLTANLVVGLPLAMQLLIGKRQTASFVNAEDVIGRDNDKNIIMGKLFDPKFDEKRLTVIPIVGFGGLGKTTLAQLIFNDEGVQNNFDLTKWVCVPEVDNQSTIIRRVYQSFTGVADSNRLLIDDIVIGIRQSIIDKKYLLVLDDIWDESRDNWLNLLNLLECGASGSRVIVTTRSANVAKAVGTTKSHNLGLLTNEESWNLFKKFAFQSEQEESNPVLTQFGKEIVDSCRNVPLAIRVIGGLLYTKNSEQEWQQIRDFRLSKAGGKEDDTIMQVLKLSYDFLPPALKQCFSYLSLFPQDYLYDKDHLVNLWMAQGYIDPSSTYNGEQYFMELLGRNLFQDPVKDSKGNIIYCKMHDLVHDLAQGIAGEEMKQLAYPSNQVSIDDGLLHVSITIEEDQWEAPESLLAARNLRSLMVCCSFNYDIKASFLERMLLKFQSLRALDLSDMEISMVPNCIGKLRHLRFLNLAGNRWMEYLPDDITNLDNLQTLDLTRCYRLKELPRYFCKLSYLRHLRILGSNNVIDYPSGFEKLTSLKKLDKFIVGKNNGIDSLPALDLIGNLEIKFGKRESDIVVEAQRVKLKDNQQLTYLELSFTRDFVETNEMLDCLQLPPNLREFDINGYKGIEMPRRWVDRLSKLVFIRIAHCRSCRVLPRMSQLPHLKELELIRLDSLEYIEDEDGILMGGGGEKCGSGAHNDYFPSLEVLELNNMGSLTGWTRPSKDGGGGELRQLLFPRLLRMILRTCPKLMSMALAPKLESLEAHEINWKLLVSNPTTSINCEEATSLASSSLTTLFPSLKQMRISRIDDVGFQSISNSLSNLETLTIYYCDSLTSLVFEPSNSIRYLKIDSCCSLKLIPEEIGNNLSVLRELKIRYCPKMASLPQSLLGLTSLQKLHILACPDLKERYKKPNGPDCHHLQHIPNVIIKDYKFEKDYNC